MHTINRILLIGLLLAGALLVGCSFDTQDNTPTAEGVVEEPINPMPETTDEPATPSPTPSATPSPTASQAVALASSPTVEPTQPPTETPLPSPTLGPWEYVIQQDDTLLFIIQQPPFNYPLGATDVINEIVRINDNVVSADLLPSVGETILIPRPTAAPAAEPAPVVAEANAIEGVAVVATADPRAPTRGRVVLPGGANYGCHFPEEGDTILSIMEQYNTTLEVLSQLNAEIRFGGCDFNIRSGGPNCSPNIQAGQCVNVPLPTPTITPSPSPSGNETPTPTPTYPAPRIASPPDGSVVSGPVTLTWATAGILQPDEVYLVRYEDLTNGMTWNGITRSTVLALPEDLAPTDGETHQIQWSVTIATQNVEGFYTPIGGESAPRTFRWQPS